MSEYNLYFFISVSNMQNMHNIPMQWFHFTPPLWFTRESHLDPKWVCDCDVSMLSLFPLLFPGDVFESEKDLENSDIWQRCSQFPEMQRESRAMIIGRADTIIPGHGAMFKVRPEYSVRGVVIIHQLFFLLVWQAEEDNSLYSCIRAIYLHGSELRTIWRTNIDL